MRRRRDDQGAVAVLVALLMVPMLMLLGLVVTRGLAATEAARAQDAADAAALGAATTMREAWQLEEGTAAALTYANANSPFTAAEWAACVDPGALELHPVNACVSFDLDTYRVRVVVPERQVPILFGFFAGLPDDVGVGASAEATWASGTVHLTR
jgi:Flp pilus assembly protein TadG